MTHPHDFALLNDLLDGRLAAAAADDLRERIAEEPDLQSAWNDLRRMRAGVRALPAPVVPSDFAARVRLRAGIPADAEGSASAGGGGVARPIDGAANHAPQTFTPQIPTQGNVAGGGHPTVPAGEGGRLLGLPRRFFAIAASVGLALGAGTWIFLEKSGYGPETRGAPRQSTADRHAAGRSAGDELRGDRLEQPRPEESDKTLLALEDARRKQTESGADDAQAPGSDPKPAAPVDSAAPRGRFAAPGGAVPPALRAPSDAPRAPGEKPGSAAKTPGEPFKPADSSRSAAPTGAGGAGEGGARAPLTGLAPSGGVPPGAARPMGGSAPVMPPPPVPAPASGPVSRESGLEAAMAESPRPERRAGAETEKEASGEAAEDLAKAKDAGGAFGEREKAKKAPGPQDGFVGGRDDEKSWKARSAADEDVLVLRAANLDVARAQVALLVAALRSPASSPPDVAGFSRAALGAPVAARTMHDADEVDPTAAREVERGSLGVLVVDLAPSAFSRLEDALATAQEAQDRSALDLDRATKLERSKAQAKSAPAKSDKAPDPALPAGPPHASPTAPPSPPPPPPSASPPTTPSVPAPPATLPAPAPAPMPVEPIPRSPLLPSGGDAPPLAEPGSVGATPAGPTASGGLPGDGKARLGSLQGATKKGEQREGDAARAMRRVRIVVLPP